MIIPLLLFISSFLVYIHNLSRSVYGGDVGDLVTSAYVGGVPHAPGYPFFTLVGFLLSHALSFFTPAFAVGIISALSGAGGVLFFYLTIRRLTKHTLISILSTYILSVSYLFWFYNEIAEVFALNNFFAIFLLYFTVRIYQKFQTKLFFLFCFTAGLACTNHQTIVLLFPSYTLLVGYALWKTHRRKWKYLFLLLLGGLGFFIVGFAPYLYVFVASMHNPPINWDSVHDAPSLLHLILRKDYGTFQGGIFLPPTLLQRWIILKSYSIVELTQLTIPVVVCSLLGVYALFRTRKLLALALFCGFTLSGPAFVFYVGFPLAGAFYVGLFERFFVLSTIPLLFFFPFGLLFLTDIWVRLTKRISWSILFPLLFFLIPLQLFFYNFPKTDLSSVYIGDTFGKDLLNPLPKDSVLFLGGDTTLFNGWYARYALGVRKDVQIVNLNGLSRDTYFVVLKNSYMRRFPDTKIDNLIRGVLAQENTRRPVFSIDPIEASGEAKLRWIPYGMTYKLLGQEEDIPEESAYTEMTHSVWNNMSVPSPSLMSSKAYGSLTIAQLPEGYANGMIATGNFYLTDYQDSRAAKDWYDKALAVAPAYPKIHSILGVWYLTISHECSKAAEEFSQANFYDPTDKLPYFFLYTTYTNCLHDTTRADIVGKAYTSFFHSPFLKAYNVYMKGQQ